MSRDEPGSGALATTLKHDGPAGTVVFLVALPLCLGLALASGAPMVAGILSGTVGGIVVGWLSGSEVSVSGPAASLTAIAFAATQTIGSYRGFLLAVVLSGVVQLVLAFLRLGVIANYIPNSVIKGMLAGIGIIIVLKQIPHAIGWDRDYEGDFSFLESGGHNTLGEIARAVASASTGAVLIFAASGALLLLWGRLGARARLFQIVPGQVAVVAVGIALNRLFAGVAPGLALSSPDHLVNVPIPAGVADFFRQLTFPDFLALSNKTVWTAAGMIAMAGSVETLMALEAADRLDPYKRISSPSRELRAQGVGNIISGLIGGIPMTSAVVRTAASVEAGAHTRHSAIIHGVLLLASLALLPAVLRMIPLACLAAILIAVGYKLNRPALYRGVWRQGWDQFLPFLVTLLALVFLDLLTGVLVGCVAGLFFVIRTNHHDSITVVNQGSDYLFRFNKDASFIHKNELRRKLRELPEGAHLIIDGARVLFIDHDIRETLEDFRQLAAHKNITVDVKRHGTA